MEGETWSSWQETPLPRVSWSIENIQAIMAHWLMSVIPYHPIQGLPYGHTSKLWRILGRWSTQPRYLEMWKWLSMVIPFRMCVVELGKIWKKNLIFAEERHMGTVWVEIPLNFSCRCRNGTSIYQLVWNWSPNCPTIQHNKHRRRCLFQ